MSDSADGKWERLHAEGTEVIVAWESKSFPGIVRGLCKNPERKSYHYAIEPTGKIPRRVRKLQKDEMDGLIAAHPDFVYLPIQADAICPSCEEGEVSEGDYLCEDCR